MFFNPGEGVPVDPARTKLGDICQMSRRPVAFMRGKAVARITEVDPLHNPVSGDLGQN